MKKLSGSGKQPKNGRWLAGVAVAAVMTLGLVAAGAGHAGIWNNLPGARPAGLNTGDAALSGHVSRYVEVSEFSITQTVPNPATVFPTAFPTAFQRQHLSGRLPAAGHSFPGQRLPVNDWSFRRGNAGRISDVDIQRLSATITELARSLEFQALHLVRQVEQQTGRLEERVHRLRQQGLEQQARFGGLISQAQNHRTLQGFLWEHDQLMRSVARLDSDLGLRVEAALAGKFGTGSFSTTPTLLRERLPIFSRIGELRQRLSGLHRTILAAGK